MWLQWISKFSRKEELRRWSRTWLTSLDSRSWECTEPSCPSSPVTQRTSFTGQCNRLITSSRDVRVWINISRMSSIGPTTTKWSLPIRRATKDRKIRSKPSTMPRNQNTTLPTKLTWKTTGNSTILSGILSSRESGSHFNDGRMLKSNSDAKAVIAITELLKKYTRWRKPGKSKT